MPGKLKGNSLLLFALIFLASGCATIYNPATGRKESQFINTPTEVSLGADMDVEMQKKIKVSKDPQTQSRLENIGSKVAGASDRKNLTYRFRIADDPDFNAFALPGGFIYVNSGLMQAANDDELACVLGHEIGHVAARHSVKRLEAGLSYQIIVGIALGVSGKQSMAQAINIMFNLISLGYSRQDEYLADKLGARYSKKAGFDPNGMVTFFKKLKQQADARGPNYRLVFLSSHPPIEERIKKVEQQIKSNDKI